MADLIDRQAAIEAATKFRVNPGGEFFEAIKRAIRRELEALPSAQPERKKGKWIYGEDEHGIDGYHCDECGFFVPWDYVHKFINYIEDYNFCPHCGADMKEDEDEAD